MSQLLPFLFLKVPAAIQSGTVPHKFAEQVSANGLNPDGSLAGCGVLQAFLLMTDVFDVPPINEVRDVRPFSSREVGTGNRLHLCRNREMLVEALADALLDYENLCRSPAWTLQGEQRWMPVALGFIKKALILQDQRRRKDLWKRKVPSEPYKGLLSFLGVTNGPVKEITRSKKTIQTLQAVETAVREFMTLTLDEYVRLAELDELKRIASSNLLEAMYRAFLQYGPPRAVYPKAAIFEAMATIFTSLELESGVTIGEVAERIRKRHGRRRKHS